MITIIGVDFSGAQNENKSDTWVTQGRLDPAGSLRFASVQPVLRADLYDLLAAVRTPAVAALDFPFGVPLGFVEHIAPGQAIHRMDDVWRIVYGMETYDAFLAELEIFLEGRASLPPRERVPQRAGDARYHPYPQSFPPLQRAPIDMRAMTYRGMKLLHRWHHNHPRRWHVPPLEIDPLHNARVTLLELMPGTFLRTIGFNHATTRFPGYKTSPLAAIQNRDVILDGLAAASGVPLPNLDTVRMGCRANADCLDSVVAAVGAAMWAQNPNIFRHPTDGELADAQLEGWIYVPNPI